MEFAQEQHDIPWSYPFWFHALCAVFCCLTAGLMSGLTIGLLSFDMTTLHVLKVSNTRPRAPVYTSLFAGR